MRQQETVISGYKIINYFPDTTTDDEWKEFALAILRIFGNENR